jgi:hypothetical protein
MEVNGQLHAPAALLPVKSARYLLDTSGWVGPRENRSECCGEEKNFALRGIEPGLRQTVKAELKVLGTKSDRGPPGKTERQSRKLCEAGKPGRCQYCNSASSQLDVVLSWTMLRFLL